MTTDPSPTEDATRFTDPALRGPDEYAGYLQMAAERSLERIGVDAFDLLLLHNPDRTGYSSEAVWDGMRSLRDQGLTERDLREVVELVPAHDPHAAEREIFGLAPAAGDRVGGRCLEHPAQVDEVRDVAKLVDVSLHRGDRERETLGHCAAMYQGSSATFGAWVASPHSSR